MENDNETDFETIDLLASEYGWSIEYIQGLEVDEIVKLTNAIGKRRKSNTQLMWYAFICAQAGKMLKFEGDDISPVTAEQEMESLLTLAKIIPGMKLETLESK